MSKSHRLCFVRKEKKNVHSPCPKRRSSDPNVDRAIIFCRKRQIKNQLPIRLNDLSSPHGRKTGHAAEAFLTLRLEHDLHPELLAILVKPVPISPFPTINLLSLKLETASLIRLGRNNQILEVFIRIFNLLLKRGHEPHARDHTGRDLLELHLEKQTHLACQGIPDLGDFVTGTTDLDRLLLDLHTHCSGEGGGILIFAFALFAGSATGEVRLVLFALRVGQVGAVILVDCETETALEAADMVLEKVGIFVEVDRLQRELAQALATVGVGCGVRGDASTTKFGACSVLEKVSMVLQMVLMDINSSRQSADSPGNPSCHCRWRGLEKANLRVSDRYGYVSTAGVGGLFLKYTVDAGDIPTIRKSWRFKIQLKR